MKRLGKGDLYCCVRGGRAASGLDEPRTPRIRCLILTHILQPEMKSKVNAWKRRFAKRASLSKWFAIQQDHHGNEPDSHPGVRLPSSRSRWSSWQASVQSAEPPPPASAAHSARSPGALGRNERRHAPATSARQEATTDPTNGSDHQREALAG